MTISATTLIQNLDGKALALAPDRMDWVHNTFKAIAANEKHSGLMAVSCSADPNDPSFWYADDNWMSDYQPYVVSTEGVLQIPVSGVLLEDLPFCLEGSMTGYDYIQAALARGASDDNVTGIMLMIDSPGGEASGTFTTSDAVRAAAGSKPVVAYAKNALSAAYGIASAADTISANKFGMFANIGTITQRVDMSQALANEGIKVHLIYAGANKADGYSSQPMTDGERARIQALVDDTYDEFTSLVAQNRNMDVQKIRDTEATAYDAKNAMAHGLVDSIATPSEAMANFVSTNDERMASVATENQAAVDAAVNAARAEERGIANREARARIGAILGCAEAKDRPKLAQHLALNTDQSEEEARGILAVSAVEVSAPAASAAPAAPAAPTAPAAPAGQAPFAQAMVATGNPNVGAELVQPQAQAPQKSRAEAALELRYGPKK